MKILGLKLINHPTLGSLTLNFKNKNKAANCMIFAGENGCGKSTILDVIYGFCSLTTPVLEPGESRMITVFLNQGEINAIRYIDEKLNFFDQNIKNGILEFGFQRHTTRSKTSFFIYFRNESERNIRSSDKGFLQSPEVKRIFGAIFLDKYIEMEVKAARAYPLQYRLFDKGRKLSQIKNFSAEKGLKSLLISNYKLVREERNLRVNHSLPSNDAQGNITTKSSLKDFIPKYKAIYPNLVKLINSALENLGSDLRIKEVKAKGLKNIKTIYFNKGNSEFPYEQLSSGEKQLIQLTSFLAFDLGSSAGAPVLIDEPENSLHPNWQIAMRDYLRTLFSNEHQIFIATHSPFIIHNETHINEKIIILGRSSEGIKTLDTATFVGWSSEKSVTSAFKVGKLKNKISTAMNIVFVEGRTDELILNYAKTLFMPEATFQIEWVGHFVNDQERFTGATALNQVANFLDANKGLIENKVICLFDCDQKCEEISSSHVVKRKIPFYAENTQFKKGIENSLVVDGLNISNFYSSKTKKSDYGETNQIQTFNKMDFATYICSLKPRQAKKVLKNLEELIKSLND